VKIVNVGLLSGLLVGLVGCGVDKDDSNSGPETKSISGHWLASFNGSDAYNGMVTENGQFLFLTEDDAIFNFAKSAITVNEDKITGEAIFCDFSPFECQFEFGVDLKIESDTRLTGTVSKGDAVNDTTMTAFPDNQKTISVESLNGTWTEGNNQIVVTDGSLTGIIEGCDEIEGTINLVDVNIFGVTTQLTNCGGDNHELTGFGLVNEEGKFEVVTFRGNAEEYTLYAGILTKQIN